MKNSINKYLGLALLFVSASCADDKFADFKTETPESIAKYEYLNAYDALKTYIDRGIHPNFKLGVGVAANDFLKGEVVRSVAAANFDEIVAGNAMKYASCVSNDGTMDFATVTKFIDAAKTAGLTVYGHTLCWHSQQNNKWLNSLIAGKEIEVDPDAANNFIKYICGEAGANIWDKQATYMLPVALEEGENYTFKVDIKASEVCENLEFWPIWNASLNRDQWGGSKDVQYLGGKGAIGTDWATYEWKFTTNFPLDKLQIVFGKFGGTICFDNLVLVKDGTEDNLIQNGDFAEESMDGWGNNWQGPSYEIGMEGSAPAVYYLNQIDNGMMETGKSMNSFIVRESGKADVPGTILEGQGPDGKNCISITSISGAVNTHDTQFFIVTNKEWQAGDRFKISFWYKATAEADCETQCHVTPGDYKHHVMLPANPHFTTEWQYYEATSSIPTQGDGMRTIAFNLNVDKANAHTYYFADITMQSEEKGNVIPITPEEKKEILTNELERWIEGMMKACGGQVTAWDVVNEPVGGDDKKVDSEGNYLLQSATNPSDNGVGGQNFYWQDFLGEDYARIPIKFARKYFAEYGGNPADLKLFINDYNLESWWDNNHKVKSLINWIKRWESDGETKIDGIGTQMHVSYILDEVAQKQQEASIVEMFKLLAATGKLIKITELDMGIVEKAFGKGIKTELITFEQQQKMSAFYKFIIQKYFEIIPVEQQYGITQWAATDSPADSGWRDGEPVGLWDLDYNRKPTYAGFADGLAGK